MKVVGEKEKKKKKTFFRECTFFFLDIEWRRRRKGTFSLPFPFLSLYHGVTGIFRNCSQKRKEEEEEEGGGDIRKEKEIGKRRLKTSDGRRPVHAIYVAEEKGGKCLSVERGRKGGIQRPFHLRLRQRYGI